MNLSTYSIYSINFLLVTVFHFSIIIREYLVLRVIFDYGRTKVTEIWQQVYLFNRSSADTPPQGEMWLLLFDHLTVTNLLISSCGLAMVINSDNKHGFQRVVCWGFPITDGVRARGYVTAPKFHTSTWRELESSKLDSMQSFQIGFSFIDADIRIIMWSRAYNKFFDRKLLK